MAVPLWIEPGYWVEVDRPGEVVGIFERTPKGWFLSMKAAFSFDPPFIPSFFMWIAWQISGSNPYPERSSAKIGILSECRWFERLTSLLACCISNWRSRTR